MEEALPKASEKFRQMLIKQELALRKKQPEHWAKTKYRKFARPYTEAELEKIAQLGEKRKSNKRAEKKKMKKPAAKKKKSD